MKYLKTSEIAHTVGVHPNTIRLYEEWGLLPPVARGANGYRLYTPMHLEQVKLIRLSTRCSFLGGRIRQCTLDVLHASAEGNFEEAFEQAEYLTSIIGIERRQAEEAEKVLEMWASGCQDRTSRSSAVRPMSIREASALLEATPDMLRDWERNGLISVPRGAQNGYRQYGNEEIDKLRVIRLLRHSRYSSMSILRVMQQLETGKAGNLREIINTPEFDEERGYLCFTDNLLSALECAVQSADDMIVQLSYMKKI